MKVLIINSMFVNALYRRCADELGKLPGVELTVLTTDGWVMNGKPMLLDPVRVDAPYRLVAGKAGWKGRENRGFYMSGLKETLRTSKPDVIYLMEEPFSVFATQILAAKRIVCTEVPVVFFTWNNLSLRKYDYRPSVAYRNFARLNLRSLNYGLTANSAGIDVLREFGFERPITSIGYGVDTAHYASSRQETSDNLRAKLGIAPGDKVMGYVGRLLHMKGVDLLVAAFAKLANSEPDAKLLLVGSGDAEESVNAQIDLLGIRDRVVQVPVVPHTQVPDYMHMLDVLVLPSRRVGMWAEQFGRVLVEAMAARKIVIGSSSGAIPEVIGDAGFVFEENNADDLHIKLSSALGLSGSELSALQDKAFERATVTYSWQRFASRSLEAMRAVVEGSAP